jgi:ribosome maturation factor RimP
MIAEKKVRELAQSRLDEFNGFIVDLSISAANQIKLLIDSDTGISVANCMSVSRNVEHNLDREVEDFSLEVSSAGIDQPFKIRRQYIKNIGREVKVSLHDELVIEGLLEEVNENNIVVLTRKKERIEGRKAKKWVETKHIINFDDIKETKVIISFK